MYVDWNKDGNVVKYYCADIHTDRISLTEKTELSKAIHNKSQLEEIKQTLSKQLKENLVKITTI